MSKEIKYVLLKDLIIPTGTVLESMPENKGGKYRKGFIVAIGKDFTGDFSVTEAGIADAEGYITELK